MKVLHVSYLSNDGSGTAVRRLNDALNQSGIESDFIFFQPFHPETARVSWPEKKVNGLQNIIISRIIGTDSLNLFPSRVLSAINQSGADVIHLHWINGEMISIGQIAKIKKPLIWTFHDMWPLCGAEHWAEDSRYIEGYASRSLFDINRYIFNRKKKRWKNLDVRIVCPGQWMADCVKRSALFRNHSVSVVPNCLDLDVFRPMDRDAARRRFGLPLEKRLILFGAQNPAAPRKGGDLLREALRLLDSSNTELVVFGALGGEQIAGFPTHWTGRIDIEKEMSALYSAADIMCVPSRRESFGQTASEPQACGVPVAAFDTGGLKDVIEHKKTGYLAKPFDVADFAKGIHWILAANSAELKENARRRAESLWSGAAVTDCLRGIYDQAAGQ